MNRGRHAPPEALEYVSLPEVSTAIGRSTSQTRKLIGKLSFLPPAHRRGEKRLYPVELIDLLNEMLGHPNRLQDRDRDWLTDYLEGELHAR